MDTGCSILDGRLFQVHTFALHRPWSSPPPESRAAPTGRTFKWEPYGTLKFSAKHFDHSAKLRARNPSCSNQGRENLILCSRAASEDLFESIDLMMIGQSGKR